MPSRTADRCAVMALAPGSFEAGIRDRVRTSARKAFGSTCSTGSESLTSSTPLSPQVRRWSVSRPRSTARAPASEPLAASSRSRMTPWVRIQASMDPVSSPSSVHTAALIEPQSGYVSGKLSRTSMSLILAMLATSSVSELARVKAVMSSLLRVAGSSQAFRPRQLLLSTFFRLAWPRYCSRRGLNWSSENSPRPSASSCSAPRPCFSFSSQARNSFFVSPQASVSSDSSDSLPLITSSSWPARVPSVCSFFWKSMTSARSSSGDPLMD